MLPLSRNRSSTVPCDAYRVKTHRCLVFCRLSLRLEGSTSLKNELRNLIEELEKKALEHKSTVCIGRSHGIFAEPTTFGLKLLSKYSEFNRHLKRLIMSEKVELGQYYTKAEGKADKTGPVADPDPKKTADGR